MKNRLTISFFILTLICFNNVILYGQLKVTEGSLSELPTFVKEVKTEKVETIEDNFDLYLKKSVTLSLKNGDVIKGYLLPNSSENGDAIIIEVNGENKILNFDNIINLVIQDDPIDIINGKIALNDLAARIDNLLIHLSNDPTSEGYIIYYYGKGITSSYINTRKKAVISHIQHRKYYENRVTQLIGPKCGKKVIIEIWVIPAGRKLPDPKCER